MHSNLPHFKVKTSRDNLHVSLSKFHDLSNNMKHVLYDVQYMLVQWTNVDQSPENVQLCHEAHRRGSAAVFSFLYLKKIKFQKYMSVFKYFKNIPRSPSHRATGPMCKFFFFKFATKSLEKKRGGDSPPFFFSDFYFCRDLI